MEKLKKIHFKLLKYVQKIKVWTLSILASKLMANISFKTIFMKTKESVSLEGKKIKKGKIYVSNETFSRDATVDSI